MGTDIFFRRVLYQYLKHNTNIEKAISVGGGCINNAVYLKTSSGDFFIKWNKRLPFDLFEAEKKGLEILKNTGGVVVPKPLLLGDIEDNYFLMMEYVPSQRPSSSFWENFGNTLANLHRNSNSLFGLNHNNYIGRLPQVNTFEQNWPVFFIENRLKPQLKLGKDTGIIEPALMIKFEALFKEVPHMFPDEPPSLLHGDLWSGNFLCMENDQVCFIDPAVYFGSREMEIAFTNLFGGFDEVFYRSYEQSFPLSPGFKNRMDICNLYPLLVHANLFGSSYLDSIRDILKKF